MPRLNLFGSQEKGLSVAINNQLSQNCYVVPSPRGRNNVAMVGSMGTASFSGTSGTMRGCHVLKGISYFVAGTSLFQVDSLGNYTTLGNVPGTGMVSIADDATSLIVVNGTTTGYYYNTSTSTFSTVTFPAKAYTVSFLDTYIAFSSDDQRWYLSAVGDSDSFSALDFASAIKSPDPLLAIFEDHSEFILFGEKTIEPWFNSANVDFAFSQNTAGVMERGTYARFSIVKEDNTLFFLGDDLLVYRLEGYQPVRISNDSTENQLSDILKDGNQEDLQNAYGIVYTEHGHKFYQLTIPNQVTLVYNVATKEWHENKHWNYETHHAVCYCNAYGKHLIGALDGQVYELSRNYYDDAGTTLRRLRRSNYYSVEDKIMHWKKIKFIFDFGTTEVLTGQGSDPKVVIRWSYDSGRTFRNEKTVPLGVAGDYLAKAIRRNCGSSRSRLIEFYVTDPVPFFLIDAYAVIT